MVRSAVCLLRLFCSGIRALRGWKSFTRRILAVLADSGQVSDSNNPALMRFGEAINRWTEVVSMLPEDPH